MTLSKDLDAQLPTDCCLCPRYCGANRALGEQGVCGADDRVLVARAALHFWEEPPISGESGSGTVFFSGCPLRCAYCQNAVIAESKVGSSVSVVNLASQFLDLQKQGALNINLVTPTHYALQVRSALVLAKQKGLKIPIVWNTSGYETVQAIRDNRGLVDVYLTDFKYASEDLARRYSRAADYPRVAFDALCAMVEEVGRPQFDEYRGQVRLAKGVVVRHLLLPGGLEDSRRIVRLIQERFGNSVLLSLMNQYTPHLAWRAENGDACALKTLERFPELGLRVDSGDYEQLLDYADSIGVEEYFWQDGESALESFIPAFDLTGVSTR